MLCITCLGTYMTIWHLTTSADCSEEEHTCMQPHSKLANDQALGGAEHDALIVSASKVEGLSSKCWSP